MRSDAATVLVVLAVLGFAFAAVSGCDTDEARPVFDDLLDYLSSTRPPFERKQEATITVAPEDPLKGASLREPIRDKCGKHQTA